MWKYIICAVISCYYFTNLSALEDRVNLPLAPKCLGCICEAISGCDTTRTCNGDICGPFRITWAYWFDGGKPTVANQNPMDPKAYQDCANDAYCAAAAVQGYMAKYYQDCNGDKVVDCDDFAAIHKLGGYGCSGTPLPDFYTRRYAQCKQFVGGNLNAA